MMQRMPKIQAVTPMAHHDDQYENTEHRHFPDKASSVARRAMRKSERFCRGMHCAVSLHSLRQRAPRGLKRHYNRKRQHNTGTAKCCNGHRSLSVQQRDVCFVASEMRPSSSGIQRANVFCFTRIHTHRGQVVTHTHTHGKQKPFRSLNVSDFFDHLSRGQFLFLSSLF